MSLYEIYKAKRLGYADDYWTSAIGHSLGGYKWISTDYETTPYIYRAMPNLSHYYNREIMDAVVGGSVGWNQLCNGSSVTVQSGHKYFLKKGSATSIGASSGSAITGLTSGSDMVVDLTLALGSTIADYIYSLEQATAGAGVAFFKTLFPKPYYAYNAGELMSVKGLVSHDMVGFNAWDEEWEVGGISNDTGETISSSDSIRSKNFIPVVPQTSYYIAGLSSGILRPMFYDADKNFIGAGYWAGGTSNNPQSTPSGCYYMKFKLTSAYGTTYNHDICINLSWDGSRNGEYEPYQKWSYPLDSDLELRGIPKIENGNLYYDGDVYEADGTVTRKYGIVDLGTLDWNYEQGGSYTRFYNTAMQSLVAKPASDYIAGNIICAKFPTTSVSRIYSGLDDKVVAVGASGTISIRDTSAGTNPSDFKTAMSGVYLVYELATPTTETAQPFTKTQNCDSGGTEEFVTNGIVSVGHKSKYAEK